MATSHQIGGREDPIVRCLRESGVPVNRANYIRLNWGSPLPPWTVEQEDELPEALRDWSIFFLNPRTMAFELRPDRDPTSGAPITARWVDPFSAEFDEAKHPRVPKGTPRKGGQWTTGANEIVHNFEEETRKRHHGATRPPSSTEQHYEQWRQKGKLEDLDRQAREAVIQLGGTEREYGVTIQRGGDLSQGAQITVLPGEKRSVKIPDDLHTTLTQHGPIDFHHNHPSDTPISTSDIAFTGQRPGVINVHAHTAESGSTYSISINGRTVEKPNVVWPKEMSKVLRHAMRHASEEGWPSGTLGDVRNRIVDQLEKRNVPPAEHAAIINSALNRIDQHAFNIAADKVGLIHYTYSLSPTDEKFYKKYGKQLEQHIENAENALKQQLEMYSMDPAKIAARSRLRIRAKDWDESEHPRGKTKPGTTPGSFAPGGEAAAAPAEPELHPDVVNVGGDQWNKDTALRLEREYQAAKPALEKMAQEAEGEEVEGVVARNWDDLDGAQQEKAEVEWMKENFDSFHDGEVESWLQSDHPKDYAQQVVTKEFNGGEYRGWAADAIQAWREGREEDGAKLPPFTDEQILDAIFINEYGGVITFDDTKLRDVFRSREEQLIFPGIEPQDYSKLLTKEMRSEITEALDEAFKTEVAERKDKLEPPDLTDETNDVMGQHWDEMSNDHKFDIASNLGVVGSTDEVVHLPTKYDPLNCDADTTEEAVDYQRTQALARHMSIERAADLIIERGVKSKPEKDLENYVKFLRKLLDQPDRLKTHTEEEIKKLRDDLKQQTETLEKMRSPEARATQRAELVNLINNVDRELWGAWKASSTSMPGKLLQVATADELGGRLNDEHHSGINRASVRDYANDSTFYQLIGGYDGVKAYIRAKWETAQYLLDKSGDQRLHLYRAIGRPLSEVEKEPTRPVVVNTGIGVRGTKPANTYIQYLSMPVKRNGAASTSVKSSVSNSWDGTKGRVVLRADVPRTAVVSIPAFGINEHSEQEVVVAGTAWHGWDAWEEQAPPFDKVKMGGEVKRESAYG
jgi:hypothetical protein